MIVTPVLMNSVQFWITDNFIRKKQVAEEEQTSLKEADALASSEEGDGTPPQNHSVHHFTQPLDLDMPAPLAFVIGKNISTSVAKDASPPTVDEEQVEAPAN